MYAFPKGRFKYKNSQFYMKKQKLSGQAGFTLIEILVVIGIIAILATIVLIAINPARQFKQARDTQRVSNVNAILNAIGQRIADNKGTFGGVYGGVTCPSLPAPAATATTLSILNDTSATTASTIGLGGCIAPTYMSALPSDPQVTTGPDTHYDLIVESIADGGRITISAPDNEIDTAVDISVTR